MSVIRQINEYEWHPWFAWYPIVLTGEDRAKSVWLCWVECRIRGVVAPDGDLGDYWEYRLPQ